MKKFIKFIPMLALFFAFALYSPTVAAQRGAGKQRTTQTQPKNQYKKQNKTMNGQGDQAKVQEKKQQRLQNKQKATNEKKQKKNQKKQKKGSSN